MTIELLIARKLGICVANNIGKGGVLLSMKIDYLGHSSFFVESDSEVLLLDYFYGDLSLIR